MGLELEKLEEVGGRFARVYEPQQLVLEDSELELAAPAEVHGRVARRNGEAELTGELHAKIRISCARCLKPVELPIDVEFTERFVRAVSWRDEEQHELQQADLNLSVFDGASIDLDDLVKEEITLAVPAQALCRENCKGLCPVCGADRNVQSCSCEAIEVDTRWAKLKNLRF